MKDEIQYILSGTSQVKHYQLIQTTCSYLKRSQGSSSIVKDQQHYKEETKKLAQFIEENNHWENDIYPPIIFPNCKPLNHSPKFAGCEYCEFDWVE
jgi:hypothetical protein